MGHMDQRKENFRNLLLRPLVLAPNLLLLLGGEVVRDVERFPDLLGRLALDHVGHGLAADVQQGLDIEIVGRLNMPKKRRKKKLVSKFEKSNIYA